MEEEDQEEKQKTKTKTKKNQNSNISISEKPEEEEKKKKSSDQQMDEECESSPLQSPLHSLDDDDDDHQPSSSPPPIKKEKPFFHRPPPQLHPQPQRQQPLPTMDPQAQQKQPPLPLNPQRQQQPLPTMDPQPQTQQKQPPVPLNPQPQRQPPPPLNPQPQRKPPPPLNPQQSTAISIMNPHQSTAIVAVNRFSPVRSPPLEKMNLSTIPPPPGISLPPPSETVTVKPQSPVFVVDRSIREELSSVSKKDGDHRQGLNGDVEDGVGVAGGGNNRKARAMPSVLSRQRKEDTVKRAALGFRVCAVVFCLVSFSVMAADKTQGWAGDSFDRYKEYRYCISVTIIGFVYASFQAYDLAYNLITEKHIIPYYIRHYFDFSMDQILTYLLISASSSAATRVDDWQTNWGKDPFTVMASASIGMSFMAFVAFAFSSLISGYNLCMRN